MVIGANSGIKKAFAKGLAEAGASVVVNYVSNQADADQPEDKPMDEYLNKLKKETDNILVKIQEKEIIQCITRKFFCH